jgi:hypothetical protein
MCHGVFAVSHNRGAACHDSIGYRLAGTIGKAQNEIEKASISESAKRGSKLRISRGGAAEELLCTPAIVRGKSVHVSDAALVQPPSVRTSGRAPHGSLTLSGGKLELNGRRYPPGDLFL